MPQRRSAYTLFEIIIVMAILVIGAAMVVPSLDSFGGETRVIAGADMVRGRLAEARSRAVEESRSYRFEIVDATHCRVVPDTAEQQQSNPGNGNGDSSPAPECGEDTLPRNVNFVLDDPASDGGACANKVVFQADGTARDDAEIRITAKGARTITLKLRAITATTSTVRPNQGNQP